jgi:hypothetical protein
MQVIIRHLRRLRTDLFGKLQDGLRPGIEGRRPVIGFDTFDVGIVVRHLTESLSVRCRSIMATVQGGNHGGDLLLHSPTEL